MPVASVIVPARNAAQTLPRTLRALGEQDLDGSFEVIVVDNGSEDKTADVARKACKSARVVSQPATLPGAARNRGAELARADLLAFTDADCVPERTWLREGVQALEHVDLVQGAVIPDPATPPGPFDRTVSVSREALYETASLFVRRSAFQRVGGFDDWATGELEQPFGEDVWFGWRVRRTGARTCFCPRAVVQHAVHPRDARGYIEERRRLAYFPALAAAVPELRDAFFFGRWFLDRRSAALDVAIAGTVCAAAARSPLPLATALPYLALVLRGAVPWGRRAPAVALAGLAADLAGAVALFRGSLAARSLVL